MDRDQYKWYKHGLPLKRSPYGNISFWKNCHICVDRTLERKKRRSNDSKFLGLGLAEMPKCLLFVT